LYSGLVVAFFLSLVVAKGFGSSALFTIAVGLSLGSIAWRSVHQRKTWPVIVCIFSFFLTLLSWPLVHLYGFWALLGRTQNDSKENRLGWAALGTAFLALWLVQATTAGSYTIFPLLGIPTFALACLCLYWFPRWVHQALVLACLLLTSVQVYIDAKPVQVEVSTDVQSAPGYSPGPLLAKIVGATVVRPGELDADVGISSLIFDSKVNHARKKLYLLEHDLKATALHKAIHGGSIQQKEPWFSNEFYGNQYLLASIARDGQWVSNLGGQLNLTGKILLASGRYRGGGLFEPLVVETGHAIYVNDSDPFVDRLAGYQIFALQELVHGNLGIRVINAIFALGSSLTPGVLSALCILLAGAGWIITNLSGFPGDVCLMGRIGWPHEPSKISGVLRSMADEGFSMVPGKRLCKIVAVDANQTVGIDKYAELVLAGPGARISIDHTTIEVDDEPLGVRSGVVDARKLIVNGSAKGVICRLGRLTVIGTGSPSKQDWKKWLPPLERP
jgi:hypothetical protein